MQEARQFVIQDGAGQLAVPWSPGPSEVGECSDANRTDALRASLRTEQGRYYIGATLRLAYSNVSKEHVCAFEVLHGGSTSCNSCICFSTGRKHKKLTPSHTRYIQILYHSPTVSTRNEPRKESRIASACRSILGRSSGHFLKDLPGSRGRGRAAGHRIRRMRGAAIAGAGVGVASAPFVASVLRS